MITPPTPQMPISLSTDVTDREIMGSLYNERNVHIPSPASLTEVVIEHTVYHKPRNLHTTRDMRQCTEAEAYYEHGACACSRCFSGQQPGVYPHPYLR